MSSALTQSEHSYSEKIFNETQKTSSIFQPQITTLREKNTEAKKIDRGETALHNCANEVLVNKLTEYN